MAYRLHHLHIICKDLEKMITFFTETLEAKLVMRKKFGTADGATLDLQGTTVNLRVSREDEEMVGTTVNLRVSREDEEMVGDASQSSYGYDHIGLQVEDIETVFTELQAQGFKFFVPPTELPDLKMAFFKGPEDITIELVQPLA
jgi:catechol 2,3-dioxygenase-like lactoylglutathione lyase family enzyme